MKTAVSRQASAAIFLLASMTLQAQPALNSTFQDAQGITYVVTRATAPCEAQVLGGFGNPNNTVRINNPAIPATVSDGEITFAVTGIQEHAFAGYLIAEHAMAGPAGAFADPAGAMSDPASALSGDGEPYDAYLTGRLTVECSGSIGYRAFMACRYLTGTLVIPPTVSIIEEGAFTGCSGLSGTLVIPATLANIEARTFSDCSGLTGLVFNNSGFIGEYAFARCPGLDGMLVIPSNVTEIHTGAFLNCTGLRSADLSAYSGDSIGTYAFLGCRGLGGLTFGSATAPKVGDQVFYGVADDGTLYYPEGGRGYDVLLSHLPAGWRAAAGNATVGDEALDIHAAAGGLRVTGLVPGESLTLYNMQGSLIYRDTSGATEQLVPLREHGIYIAIAGRRTAKAAY
jgi:hypothetical protein